MKFRLMWYTVLLLLGLSNLKCWGGSYTSNLNLYKPALHDTDYITPFATGMDRIDTEITAVSASTAALETSKLDLAGGFMTGQLSLVGSTLTVTGDSFSVGGSTLTVKAGVISLGGPLRHKALAQAAIEALTPTVGDEYRCSDCTVTSVVVSTAANGHGFVGIGGMTKMD